MYAESKSFKAIPTGVVIKEKLAEKNISFEDFARQVSMSYYDAQSLLDGEIIVTEKIAKRLEDILRIDNKYWLRLEAEYRQNLVKVMIENELDIKVK